jgi:hypothetical protein
MYQKNLISYGKSVGGGFARSIHSNFIMHGFSKGVFGFFLSVKNPFVASKQRRPFIYLVAATKTGTPCPFRIKLK